MSEKTWPRIRTRSYSWQDKTGQVRRAQSWFIDVRLPNGKRYQRMFKSAKDAQTDAARLRMEQKIERQNRVVSLANLTDEERIDVMNALKKLAGRVTLTQAAEFYVEHNDLPAGALVTVQEAVERYLAQSAEDGLRPRSIKDLEAKLDRFAETFGARPVAHISRNDADEWHRTLKPDGGGTYSQLTRRHIKTIVGGLFNWCIEKGYTKQNPFTALARGRRGKKMLTDQAMPGSLTAEQVTAIMQKAQAAVPEMVPALALAFFAGLRTNELRHIEWRDVSFEHCLVRVRPEVAKKRQARNVDMQPNLVRWLLPHRRDSGFVAPRGSDYRKKFDTVRKLAGCLADYPRNGARHTFATMHVVQFNDAAKTALQLGHVGGTGILFDHYRALATPKEAEQFWRIAPTTAGDVIELATASA